MDMVTVAGVVALVTAAAVAFAMGPMTWYQLALMALGWLSVGIWSAVSIIRARPLTIAAHDTEA
jgi:hypothetical protein